MASDATEQGYCVIDKVNHLEKGLAKANEMLSEANLEIKRLREERYDLELELNSTKVALNTAEARTSELINEMAGRSNDETDSPNCNSQAGSW